MAASTAATSSTHFGDHSSSMSYLDLKRPSTVQPLMRETSRMSVDAHMASLTNSADEFARIYDVRRPGDHTAEYIPTGNVSPLSLLGPQHGQSAVIAPVVEQSGPRRNVEDLLLHPGPRRVYSDNPPLIIRETEIQDVQKWRRISLIPWRNPFNGGRSQDACLGEVELIHGEDGVAEHHEHVRVSEKALSTGCDAPSKKRKFTRVCSSGASSIKARMMKCAREISKVWRRDSAVQSSANIHEVQDDGYDSSESNASDQRLLPTLYRGSRATPYPRAHYSNSMTTASDHSYNEPLLRHSSEAKANSTQLNTLGLIANSAQAKAHARDFMVHIDEPQVRGIFKKRVRDKRVAKSYGNHTTKKKQLKASESHREKMKEKERGRSTERRMVQVRARGGVGAKDGKTITDPVDFDTTEMISVNSIASAMARASRMSGLAALGPGPG